MPAVSRKQYYLPDTNILVTRFLTKTGVGEVTDFMPIQQATHRIDRHGIVRAVHVVNGSLSFDMTCRPAFNYARDPHTVHRLEQGLLFQSASLTLGLFSTVPLEEGRTGWGARFIYAWERCVGLFCADQCARAGDDDAGLGERTVPATLV